MIRVLRTHDGNCIAFDPKTLRSASAGTPEAAINKLQSETPRLPSSSQGSGLAAGSVFPRARMPAASFEEPHPLADQFAGGASRTGIAGEGVVV